jgi:hypothetical protein
MSARWILGAALAFIVLLGGLTIAVVVEHGPDVLTLASLLVLGMFAFGIVGALRHPPGE